MTFYDLENRSYLVHAYRGFAPITLGEGDHCSDVLDGGEPAVSPVGNDLDTDVCGSRAVTHTWVEVTVEVQPGVSLVVCGRKTKRIHLAVGKAL